jgi:peptide chain release factor 2
MIPVHHSNQEIQELWEKDRNSAIKLQRQVSLYKDKQEALMAFDKELKDQTEMLELAREENDFDLLKQMEFDIEALYSKVKKTLIDTLLSDALDSNDCFVEIRAGAGGIEACDWVQTLTRMYMRWGETLGYKTELVDYTREEMAGYKSSTVKITGKNAFGWAKYEAGVHRFVRISPFDSNAKRHTSFVSVQVLPSSDDEQEMDIEINSRDLKIEVMRSQGAGGQHVNTTESAVRITHIPTKTVAFCQNERSQHKNKATAMEMLRARLYTRKLQELSKEKRESHSQLSENAWGSQIRSYVLHPYQMIKDSRSGYSTNDVDSVLNGNLQEFMYQSLLYFKTKK